MRLPLCGFDLCFRVYVVVHVSFILVHGEQPWGPEFHTHLRFRLRHRSQARTVEAEPRFSTPALDIVSWLIKGILC